MLFVGDAGIRFSVFNNVTGPGFTCEMQNGRNTAMGSGLGGVVTPSYACGPTRSRITERMKKISYSGYRFPPEIGALRR